MVESTRPLSHEANAVSGVPSERSESREVSCPKRARYGVAHWSLVGLSVALTLAGGELMVRASPPLTLAPEHRQPRGLYVTHPAIGWMLAPGFSGRFRTSDFGVMVQANNEGLRDRDYGPKPAGTVRVLGLGDSFAFGWGVENAQGMFKVLERLLNAHTHGTRYEVVNAGIPDFGTYEALQLLQQVGLRYDPDLVILAFYEGNDYENNGVAPRRRTIIDGYLQAVSDTPSSALGQWVEAHSRLGEWVQALWVRLQAKRAFRRNVDTTKRLLLEMKLALDARRTPLVLLMIPDQDPAAYTRPRVLRTYDRLAMGMSVREAREQLKVLCGAHDIAYCQLSARFEDGPEAPRLRLADNHFNQAGHAMAAEELLQFLQETVLGNVYSVGSVSSVGSVHSGPDSL